MFFPGWDKVYFGKDGQKIIGFAKCAVAMNKTLNSGILKSATDTIVRDFYNDVQRKYRTLEKYIDDYLEEEPERIDGFLQTAI